MPDAGESPQPTGLAPADLDYEIIRRIGRGGYGEVWLVRDKAGEFRACKVIYRESFQHQRPYEREYEGICKFEPVSRSSESQVRILYVGRRDAAGYFFYIMELADDAGGASIANSQSYVPKTLRGELDRRGRLPAKECLQIGILLTEALENLHEHGLIHRDVKPANIIFVKGVPKLADIGLVTEADVSVSYVGTGGFIPPEGPSSPQADVYGLGKTLYEISTGKDRMEYPELPADFGELPDRAELLEFNAIVNRACEADAKKRYASAAEMRSDLLLLQAGKSVRQARLSRARRRMLAIAAMIGGLALLTMAANMYLTKSNVTNVNADEAKIRDEFRVQLAGGKSADRQQAAFRLLERANAGSDPAMQFASLRVASVLAATSGNFSLAMQICDQMADRFHAERLPAKTALLTQACRDDAIPAKRVELAGFCIRTGFEALGVDDYQTGQQLAELSKTAAHQSGVPELAQEAGFLDSEMDRCRDGFERVAALVSRLRQQPNDREASFAVGQFLCFVKNDWQNGLPLMARGSNDAFTAVMAGEMSQTARTTDDEVALAKAWADLANSASPDDRLNDLGRARYWSMKAVMDTKEPAKSSLRERLLPWLEAVPAEAAELHIRSRVAGSEIITIDSDEVRWESGRGALESRVNEFNLADLKAGDLKIVKNTGATRFLPNSVDFLSARLVVNHKPKKGGVPKFEARTDHIQLTLAHSRPGYAEVDVTILFSKQP